MILITGGAGYIGSHINKLLNKSGYDTIVLDNLIKGHEEAVKWGKFVNVDLGDENELKSVFETYDIEAVMHFAAFSSVAESVQEPEKYFKNNYEKSSFHQLPRFTAFLKLFQSRKMLLCSRSIHMANPN